MLGCLGDNVWLPRKDIGLGRMPGWFGRNFGLGGDEVQEIGEAVCLWILDERKIIRDKGYGI